MAARIAFRSLLERGHTTGLRVCCIPVIWSRCCVPWRSRRHPLWPPVPEAPDTGPNSWLSPPPGCEGSRQRPRARVSEGAAGGGLPAQPLHGVPADTGQHSAQQRRCAVPSSVRLQPRQLVPGTSQWLIKTHRRIPIMTLSAAAGVMEGMEGPWGGRVRLSHLIEDKTGDIQEIDPKIYSTREIEDTCQLNMWVSLGVALWTGL